MSIDPVWPSPELEAEMIRDYDTDTNAGCHIRALLFRVRELEAEMADQSVRIARQRELFCSQVENQRAKIMHRLGDIDDFLTDLQLMVDEARRQS